MNGASEEATRMVGRCRYARVARLVNFVSLLLLLRLLSGELARERALLKKSKTSLALSEALLDNLVVLLSKSLRLGNAAFLLLLLSTLASDASRSNKTLNLGVSVSGVGLTGLLVDALDGAANDEAAEILLLVKLQELAQGGSALGVVGLGAVDVGETIDFLSTLLNNDEVKNGDLGGDNATTNGLALAFTSLAGAVARLTLGEQETNTVLSEDTLLHGETLEIVTTSDLKEVTFPVAAEDSTIDNLGDALLNESANDMLILDVEDLLSARDRVCDVEL